MNKKIKSKTLSHKKKGKNEKYYVEEEDYEEEEHYVEERTMWRSMPRRIRRKIMTLAGKWMKLKTNIAVCLSHVQLVLCIFKCEIKRDSVEREKLKGRGNQRG